MAAAPAALRLSPKTRPRWSTVTSTDPENTARTYSISGGADAARFSIDATTGALGFIAAPNFEAPTDAGANNVYDVIVQASDGALTDTQALAITVTDVAIEAVDHHLERRRRDRRDKRRRKQHRGYDGDRNRRRHADLFAGGGRR